MRHRRLTTLTAALLTVLSLTVSPNASAVHALPAARACTKHCRLATRPHPWSVGLHPDSSRAVTQTITAADGGTITATAANGSTFTLTIPKDALLFDTQISVIPVSGISHLPLSKGLIGAVELEPSGLSFLQPATLSITASTGRLPLAFSSLDSGSDFHLMPENAGKSKLTIQIMHFSSYGAGQGSATTIAQAGQRPTGNFEADVAQYQAMIAAERTAALKGKQAYPPSELAKQEAKVLDDWYNRIESEYQQAMASQDENFVQSVMRDIGAYNHYVEVRGAQTGKGETMFHDLLRRLYQIAYQKCVDQHQIAEYRPLLSYVHALALIGVDTGNSLQQCLTFQVDFTLTTSAHQSSDTTSGIGAEDIYHLDRGGTVSVKGLDMVLALNSANQLGITGSQPLQSALSSTESSEHKFTPGPGIASEDEITTTTWTSEQAGQPFTATLSIDWGGPITPGQPLPTPTLTLDFQPGTLQINTTITDVCQPCLDQADRPHTSTKTSQGTDGWYSTAIHELFEPYLAPGSSAGSLTPTYRISGITPNGDALLKSTHVVYTNANAGVTEDAVLDLHHGTGPVTSRR